MIKPETRFFCGNPALGSGKHKVISYLSTGWPDWSTFNTITMLLTSSTSPRPSNCDKRSLHQLIEISISQDRIGTVYTCTPDKIDADISMTLFSAQACLSRAPAPTAILCGSVYFVAILKPYCHGATNWASSAACAPAEMIRQSCCRA